MCVCVCGGGGCVCVRGCRRGGGAVPLIGMVQTCRWNSLCFLILYIYIYISIGKVFRLFVYD